MTLGIVLNCPNGVVIGSDRKTVKNKGVRIQSKRSKIEELSLGEVPLLFCHAGARTVARRAIAHIDPKRFEDVENEFHAYMTEVVERVLPQFESEYKEKHGGSPNYRLGIGTIAGDRPAAATVYPTGEFDYEDSYTAVGSGSLLAEHFLRDDYCKSLSVDDGRKFVGFVIQRVAEIDSNVEGVDVRSINLKDKVERLDPAFKSALQVMDVLDYGFNMNIQSHIEEIDELSDSFRAGAEEYIEE